MVADNKQELQEKDLFQKADIRTMKKDLARLREDDSLKEREKIVKIKPAEEKAPKVINIPPEVQVPLPPPSPLQSILSLQEKEIAPAPEKILQQNTIQQNPKAKNAQFANEAEKQQIFLLQSERSNLEKQIKETNRGQEPGLILEKNKILIEQKDWQEKLGILVQEIEKSEAGQKTLEEKIKATNISSEKQALEKETWNVEGHRQEMEKKRWVMEAELSKLEERIKKLDQGYQQFNTQEDVLRAGIAKIDASLNAVYSAIAKRKEVEEKEAANAMLQKEKEDLEEKNSMQRQSNILSAENSEKEYLRGIPMATKEKLAKSAAVEEKQRRKFMEDVEKWAEEKRDENIHNIHKKNE